jgi:hypothetical protein
MGSSPRLPFHQSGVSESNRSRSPQTTCASHYTSRPVIFCQWTCRELNPEALSASQSADPSASLLVMPVTRVGFEPDLAGLKDQQPRQKLNEPYCFFSSVSAHIARSCSSGVLPTSLRLLPLLHCEWTGRCSNPPLRFFRPPLYRLSYQSICSIKRWK